jgi:hypothetical protein
MMILERSRKLVLIPGSGVHALEKKLGRIIPFLFPYLSGKHRVGQRRCDFRKAWSSACNRGRARTLPP